jgi:hypothetical protein
MFRCLFIGICVLAVVGLMELPGWVHAQHGRGGSRPGSRSSFRSGFQPGSGGFGRRDFNARFNRFDRFEDRLENRFPFGRFDRFEDRFENRFLFGRIDPRFNGGYLPRFTGGFLPGFPAFFPRFTFGFPMLY